MRTNNKKWTVPILALVPALALAAFLAVGLLTPNSAQARDDGECGFNIENGGGAGGIGDITPQADKDVTTDEDTCTVLGDSVTVKIENMDTETDSNVVILVSGGSDYDVQARTLAGSGGVEVGKDGLDEQAFKIAMQEKVGRTDIPGSATFTVTDAMAKGGVVYLAIYDVSETKDLSELDADEPSWPTDLADETQTIIFLGAPSLTQPDDGSTTDVDDDPDPSSTLAAEEGGGITLVTGETRMYSIGVQDDDTMATVIATVMDGNGRALADGIDDVDSTVTFSYEYTSGSDLKPSRRMVDSRTVDVENDGTAEIELDDWKTGEKAVRLTVSAMYSGPTGDLDLGEVVLSRTGPADSIEASIYNFDCVDTGMNLDTDAAGILDDTIDMKADDCAMDMRFGVNQMFIVNTKVKDVLGSVKPVDTVTVDLPDDDDVLTEAEHGNDAASPAATDFIVYTVGEKAPLGMHMVTVTHTSDDVDDVELMFYVAGPPASYMIEGSSHISLNGSETYVVTALDANDGIPYFEMAKPTVEIFIQGLERGNTRYLMTNETELGLDPDTGVGSFAIYAPPGTMDGAKIRIFVSSGDIEQEHVVTFGDPDATPDPMETDEFTADYTVTATSTAGSGMVDVSWTRSEELSLSLVSLIQGNEVVDFTIVVGTSAQFSEVDLGEYDVSVFSLRNNADGKDGEIAFGTVTVE